MKRTWQSLGIKVGNRVEGKTLCPRCSHTRRKNPTEECLSFDTKKMGGVFKCHHCGWAGYLDSSQAPRETKFVWDDDDYDIPDVPFDDWKLNAKTLKFFKERGISKPTLDANFIRSTTWVFGGDYDKPAIVFPFFKGEDIVQIQFRALEDKRFKMVKGCQQPFYGLQHIIEDGNIATKRLIIVEGLIDKLALYEVGHKFVLSVPNGSPFEEEGKPSVNPKLKFMDDPDAQTIFEYVDEIVFATDNDHPGRRLRDEMAKRLGVDKCRIVDWPKGCKDANDVLIQRGVDALLDCIANAKSFPTSGIIELHDLRDKLYTLHETGITPGWSTGFRNLDEIFTVKDGYVSCTTGVPEVGKSTFWNNISKNICQKYDMHCGLWSPENRPTEVHASNLMQLYSGKKFDEMTQEELAESYEWVNAHYSWINPAEPSMVNIFELMAKLVMKHGTKLFVLDPYASVIVDPKYGSEHQFIRELLSRSLDFVDKFKVHLAWIAHPTKLTLKEKKREEDVAEWPVPNAYNISGSAHWFNKLDFILSLWRTNKRGEYPIHVWCQKSKVKQVARSRQFRMFTYDEETDLYMPFSGEPDERLDFDEEFVAAKRMADDDDEYVEDDAPKKRRRLTGSKSRTQNSSQPTTRRIKKRQ